MPLRARDIADICDDLAIERASVTVMGGWDPDATQFVLTFGRPAYQQTMVIDPKWELDDLKAKLEAVRMGPVPVAMPKGGPPAEAFKPYIPMLEEDAKRLEKAMAPPAKPVQKRKKANARPG